MFRRFRLSGHANPGVVISAGLGSIVMMRTRAILRIVGLWLIPPIPGDSEKRQGKDQQYSYPEPALVPLGEKPKV